MPQPYGPALFRVGKARADSPSRSCRSESHSTPHGKHWDEETRPVTTHTLHIDTGPASFQTLRSDMALLTPTMVVGAPQ